MSSTSILTASKEDVDAAKRMSDIVNSMVVIHPLDTILHSWIAIRLSDGGYDGVLYDTRREAVRHQQHETQCAYVFLGSVMGGMPVAEAHAYLAYHRLVYENGARLPDPEAPNGGPEICMPLPIEDVRSHIRRLHNRKRKA